MAEIPIWVPDSAIQLAAHPPRPGTEEIGATGSEAKSGSYSPSSSPSLTKRSASWSSAKADVVIRRPKHSASFIFTMTRYNRNSTRLNICLRPMHDYRSGPKDSVRAG